VVNNDCPGLKLYDRVFKQIGFGNAGYYDNMHGDGRTALEYATAACDAVNAADRHRMQKTPLNRVYIRLKQNRPGNPKADWESRDRIVELLRHLGSEIEPEGNPITIRASTPLTVAEVSNYLRPHIENVIEATPKDHS
jgi:hypothetical protein